MLVRKILPALIRGRGTPSWHLGSFHSQAQSQLRRSDFQTLHIKPVFSRTSLGFLRSNYSTASQNERQQDPVTHKGDADASENPSRTADQTGPSDAADESGAQLKESVAKLELDLKEMRDKYMRALAETENVRQRLTRQINDAKQFGIQSFVKDLLEVSDILSKAMETIPKEAFKEKNPNFENLFEGLKLTEAQLSKVFKRHGLEKVDPLGEKFDPNEHEALFEAPSEGKETGTILAVTQTGFKLNKRIVRPARVGVVRNA